MENSKNNRLFKAESSVLAHDVAFILLEKKALAMKMFDVRESSPMTDFYINVTGRSQTQVKALVDEVVSKIGLEGRDPLHVEGRSGGSWILVDYGDVIVNVFDKESRDFYNFDRLLSEDLSVDISGIVAEVDKKFEINTAKEI